MERPRQERPLREDLVTQTSLEVYGAVRHDGWLADRALEVMLRRKRQLYSHERRAIAEQVYGLLRRQRTVDFLLERADPALGSRPRTQQDLLRLAAARVLEGGRPAQVAKAMALGTQERSVVERLPQELPGLDRLGADERLAITASVPDFLARRLRALYVERAEEEARAFNQRAPLTARVNTLKLTREALQERLRTEQVEARPTPLSPVGLFLETRLNAFTLPAFRDGLFELQDEGSQLLGFLVDAPPTKVVDACAGAGGKTLQLAAQMKNRGDLYALDVDEKRLDELKRRARRDGVHNVRIQVIAPDDDALPQLEAIRAKADRVLVDAPCSGTGTFRRKPDARYRLTEEQIAAFASRQLMLLRRFAPLVKPGGELIYGTCSLLREENEDVIERFLAQAAEFSIRPVAERLPAAVAQRVAQGPFLRLSPAQHGTDGFFGAILRRSPAR